LLSWARRKGRRGRGEGRRGQALESVPGQVETWRVLVETTGPWQDPR